MLNDNQVAVDNPEICVATETMATEEVEKFLSPKDSSETEVESGGNAERPKQKGPFLGVIWLALTFVVVGVVFGTSDYNVYKLVIGGRSLTALVGYLIMQVGLWRAENKWDEEGSLAFLDAAGQDPSGVPPETLEGKTFSNVVIPEDKLKASFPIPWGFLIGWWLWGISYLFPLNGSSGMDPNVFGIIAMLVCFGISFVASIPMSDAVMHRVAKKKKVLSLMFLLGWITLGIMSSLDVSKQLDDHYSWQSYDKAGVWILCMLGPFTVILSQKILFGARKMGTLWELSGVPNFHPIVCNLGGPLFVWGWFLFLLGVAAVPDDWVPSARDAGSLYIYDIRGYHYWHRPDMSNVFGGEFEMYVFLNWRTLLAFVGGCAMVPLAGFLDFSHDEGGPWCGENGHTPKAIFKKWWLGTDGSYFGLFLESPWPILLAWSVFGLSSFFNVVNEPEIDGLELIIAVIFLVTCILLGVVAGILIQQNIYGGNIKGKQKFSRPFVGLFILLALNIGVHWRLRALALSIPGTILIILGQKFVFSARKRGDYTMVHGQANPYCKVYVYTWGEVLKMMGWILVSWGASMPL